MEQKILEKLESMDVKFSEQLSALDTKFSEQLSALDTKFSDQLNTLDVKFSSEFKKVNKKLNEHTEQIDFIVNKVAEHDTDIQEMKIYLKEEVATKKDLERIYTTLDEILGHVKKNDQEITFMGNRITRLEKQASTK